MGKNPDPTFEELELIFKGFSEGKNDEAVLEDIQENLTIPRKSRFIKQRRLHYEVARKVLEAELKHEIDPIIIDQRKKHFEHLAEIADSLLSSRLKDIEEIINPEDTEARYAVIAWWEVDVIDEYSLGELIDRLGRNLDLACAKFGNWEVMDSFMSHLKDENAEAEAEGILTTIKKNPLGLIETLRIVSGRRTFRGTCPVCKDW